MKVYLYICPNGHRYTPAYLDRPPSFPQKCHTCNEPRLERVVEHWPARAVPA